MSKDKDKKRRLRQQKWEKEKAQLEDMRQKAPEVKRALRKVGCDLPFYEYLDSYSAEFTRTVTWASARLPSLLGVHEVDEADFAHTDWSKFGSANDRQIFFDIGDQFTAYGSNDLNANLRGCTAFFRDGDDTFKSIVLIPRSPKCSVVTKELKYALKIGTLVHELGHVDDAEKRGNIDPIARRFDLIEAEAYANCYALERLAERGLLHTYDMVYDAMQKLATTDDYVGEIGRLVIQRHEHREIPKWQDYMDAASAVAGIR